MVELQLDQGRIGFEVSLQQQGTAYKDHPTWARKIQRIVNDLILTLGGLHTRGLFCDPGPSSNLMWFNMVFHMVSYG